jgi:hypothetical protein
MMIPPTYIAHGLAPFGKRELPGFLALKRAKSFLVGFRPAVSHL